MHRIEQIARKIPGLQPAYRAIVNWFARRQLGSVPTEEVFTDIYRHNKWHGDESVSGVGSGDEQTIGIISELPGVLAELEVSTLLDVPCGDFNWMRNVDLGRVQYTGADIVPELVQSNSRQFTRDNVSFRQLDLLKDQIPSVDLIFCRDCLVHLSFEDIASALANICNSKSRYLLTTTFLERTANNDITTGQWRPLNLELEPFSLPKPARVVLEGCTEAGGMVKDKALGLWSITDIRACLSST